MHAFNCRGILWSSPCWRLRHQVAGIFCGASVAVDHQEGAFPSTFFLKLTPNVTACSSQARRESSGMSKCFWRQDVISGHIHMAKISGTTINGGLALNYERVCGHKGYSYVYAQAQSMIRTPFDAPPPWHDKNRSFSTISSRK